MYKPREDSFLLVEAIKKLDLRGERALDMGTGSGVIAVELAKRFKEVIAADIEEKAVEHVRGLGIKNIVAVRSDLFSNIMGKFDLIVFNPPYLPCPYEEDPELCCGDGEIIQRFLEEAKNFLRPNGKILILTSSLTPIKIKGKPVVKKKLEWETLHVWKLF